jgi:biopolymer transport protein ExbB
MPNIFAPLLAETTDIPTQSVLEMFIAAGPTVWPIFVASFVMTLVVFERFVSLRKGRILPGPFINCLLSQVGEGALDRDEATELCVQDGSPIARVFAAGLRKWGKPAVEVEQAILDEGERTANVLRRYLRVLSGVATVTPLLGLLGTVWGMIEAFNAISGSSAMGRPELLAGGISGALLSTAAGLLVAIPSYILHLYFVGRVDSLVMEIDSHGQQLVHLISTEALSDRKQRKKAA